MFVAVAESSASRVMTSPDGITWTSRTAAANDDWSGVTYGGGLFVAVASSGTGDRVMTSPDGITWTSRTSAADNDWYGVAYGNNTFIAVGATSTGNRVMRSAGPSSPTLDPQRWTLIAQSLPMPASGHCADLNDADAFFAYGAGVTGYWVKAWEPWVNDYRDANGDRIGGWACSRSLGNTGPGWYLNSTIYAN